MDGEGTPFLQDAQGLHQNRLTVPAGDVVIDIVGSDGVKGLVREIQFQGISPGKFDSLGNALRTGIVLA